MDAGQNTPETSDELIGKFNANFNSVSGKFRFDSDFFYRRC